MDRLSLKSWALAVALIIGLAGAASAFEEDNLPPGQSAVPAAVTLSNTTRGVVFFTAAINSDGTVASCFHCNTAQTFKLSTGAYQVDFGQDIRANNGFSRWVQPDTLTTGSENAWCNTADRGGDVNAVFVNCQTTGGPGSMGNSKPVDTSFFLFVAR
jgi:hypothetical protein